MIELITTTDETVTFEGVFKTSEHDLAPDTVWLGQLSTRFLTIDQIEQIRQVLRQGIKE